MIMDTELAWNLFVDGFTETAFARRYATRFRVGPLAGVRFDRGEVFGLPFEEFFAYACAPAEVLAALAEARTLPRAYLSVLDDRPGLQEAYEGAGYRLDDTEALMACDLRQIRPPAPEPDVRIVRTVAEAAWYNTHDPQERFWILPDNLADRRMTHYAIVHDGQLVARGRNLHLDTRHSYVSRVYTAEAYRRRGFAAQLMQRLLADDIARGAHWSILSASRQGQALYTRLGYRALGTILIFESGSAAAL